MGWEEAASSGTDRGPDISRGGKGVLHSTERGPKRTGSSGGACDRSDTSVWESDVKRVLEVGSERKGTSERRLMRIGSCVKGSDESALAVDGGKVEAEAASGDLWNSKVVCTYA